MIDQGMTVEGVDVEFNKVFDMVLHCRLIQNIIAPGIHGNEIDWIPNWLGHGRESVVVEGCYSD